MSSKHVSERYRNGIYPVERREATVRRRIDVSGFGDMRDVEFTRTVERRIRLSSRGAAVLGGRCISETSEFFDLHGFATSVREAFEAAAAEASGFGEASVGIRVTIKLEQDLVDVVTREDRLARRDDPPIDHVADVPREWDVEGMPRISYGKEPTFVLSGAECAEAERLRSALLEIGGGTYVGDLDAVLSRVARGVPEHA